jgi:hypothetical protein
VIMVALAVAVAAGAGEGSRLYSLPLAALSSIFAFAAYVSVRPLAARRSLLRGAVVASLVAAVGGAVFIDPALPVVMAPAVALLAQSAGLIFQGKR